ncbi:MAG: hypothetical protein RR550_01090 [Rikenellaceae bacterium]
MRHLELLKLATIVILLPIILWMLSFRGTVRVWSDYRAAKAELALCDTIREVVVEKKERLSLMDFVALQEVKLLKYNSYTGADGVIINELIISGDFIMQVKFIDSLSDYWDISSLSFTADNSTIIIQELML